MDQTTLYVTGERSLIVNTCSYIVNNGTETLMILVQIFVVFVIFQRDAIVVESTKLAKLSCSLCSKCCNFLVGLLSKNCS